MAAGISLIFGLAGNWIFWTGQGS